jgi:hypothetical protein
MCFTVLFNAKNVVKNKIFVFKIKNLYSFKEWTHYLDTTDKTELGFTLS